MMLPIYTAQLEYEQRLQDAERRRAHLALIRDASEQSPIVVYVSLWQQIRRRFGGVQMQAQVEQQGAVDACRATAV